MQSIATMRLLKPENDFGPPEPRRSWTVCTPRRSGTSHHVFKTPWVGDPRINLQASGRDAKPYQIRQLLAAVERYERLSKGTDYDG